ncbi:zinc ABC transporter [Methyloceanibacter marginalis]|uniref:Zinc ABC transporter n=1 Tax=Methyloceanibacter marginalis TaxID=1774971 RepID=A0A1E3WCW3_9HYPH|nr:cation diffusion facilitator family transporter [Methyloceanibacter marginalis]ODS03616.1 zinc ABC transporter [Methyloceanibacter marginalis]
MLDHSVHLPERTAANERALKISGWLTGVYFLIELGIGIYTGSVAVTSDAFHTFSAVGGVVLAFVASRIARRPASLNRTFGNFRAEIIGALLNGVFLAGMAVLVLVMGAMRLRSPIDLPTTPLLVAAGGGLLTEIIAIRLLYTGQKGDLNLRGAFWHVMQTFIGSILILITAAVIYFTGFLAIDPILGMAFGLVLLAASWGIIRDALSILMEGAPKSIDLNEVADALRQLPDARNVHHMHAWSLTSGKNVFSAHIETDSPESGAMLLEQGHRLLRDRFGFYFSTIQVETVCLDEDHARELDISSVLRRPLSD